MVPHFVVNSTPVSALVIRPLHVSFFNHFRDVFLIRLSDFFKFIPSLYYSKNKIFLITDVSPPTLIGFSSKSLDLVIKSETTICGQRNRKKTIDYNGVYITEIYCVLIKTPNPQTCTESTESQNVPTLVTQLILTQQ